jgi:hypothetical protein
MIQGSIHDMEKTLFSSLNVQTISQAQPATLWVLRVSGVLPPPQDKTAGASNWPFTFI